MRILTGPFARAGAVSFADQALLSATNFTTGVLLARHAAPGDYGAFALAFTMLLFFGGFQASLVTTPLTILGAPLEGAELRGHVTAALLAQLGLGFACAAISLGGAGVVAVAAAGGSLAGMLAAMSVALPFVQAQELCRRVLFLRLQPWRVLANDLAYCGLQIAAVLTLLWLDRGGASSVWLIGRNVFLTMSVAAAVGSVVGLLQIRGLLDRTARAGALERLRAFWSLARWNLGALAGQTMFLHANRLIVASFAGTAGVAALEAPRLLVAPLQIVATGAGNLTLPKATRTLAEKGFAGMMRFLTPVSIVWAATFIGYAGVIAVAPSFWLHLAYAGKYDGGRSILLVWCATNALMGLRVMPSVALRATRNLSRNMTASLIAGVTVVVASTLLCARFGPLGAALAKLIGEAALLGAMSYFFVRLLRGRRDPARPASLTDELPLE